MSASLSPEQEAQARAILEERLAEREAKKSDDLASALGCIGPVAEAAAYVIPAVSGALTPNQVRGVADAHATFAANLARIVSWALENRGDVDPANGGPR